MIDVFYDSCNLCFGRGYRVNDAGKTRTCRRCGGSGCLPHGTPNPDPWGWDPVKRCVTYNGKPVA